MDILFVNKKIDVKKALNKDLKDILIVSIDKNVVNLLKKQNIPYKTLDNYHDNDLHKKFIKWIKAWPNQKIANNKNIKEYFTYQDVSLWWLAEFYLFDTKIFFPSYYEILEKTEKIKKIIEIEKPQKVLYFDDTSEESIIIDRVCSSIKVKKIVISSKKNKNNILKSVKRKGIICYKLLRNLQRNLFWKVLSLFEHYKGKGSKILIFTESQWGEVRDKDTQTKIIGDIRFYNIIKELNKAGKFNITLTDNPIGSELRLKHFTKRLNNLSKNPPIENYMSLSDIISSIKDKNKIKKSYKKVKDDIDYTYDGVNLKETLKPKMDFFFSDYLFEIILFFKMINKGIRKENPSVLIVSSESNPPQRIAIALARKMNIPSISIQHGIVMENDLEYTMEKEDISKDLSCDAPFLPIPNYLCVYGARYKKVFLEYNNYKSDQIVITGNPKYDSIINMKKEEIKKKLCIKGNKKVVLFLATCANNYGKDYYNEVYDSFKGLKGTQIIIKLHPNDINKGLHKRLLSSKSIKNAIIIKKCDIFELGICCDVMVSTHSTGILDIGLLKRPIIIFNPGKKDSFANELIEAEAGVGVYDRLALENNIKELLQNEGFKKNVIKMQERFINESNYLSDGKSSKRVVNLIKKVLKNGKNL